jgi:hypothetical protein
MHRILAANRAPFSVASKKTFVAMALKWHQVEDPVWLTSSWD